MLHFFETFPDRKIVYSLSGQLSWTHFRNIIYIKDSLAREFYTEMCRLELWSVRTLQAKIQGMLFERTALSKKPEELARKEPAALRDEDVMMPDLVFKDPYFLEFPGLSDTFNCTGAARCTDCGEIMVNMPAGARRSIVRGN